MAINPGLVVQGFFIFMLTKIVFFDIINYRNKKSSFYEEEKMNTINTQVVILNKGLMSAYGIYSGGQKFITTSVETDEVIQLFLDGSLGIDIAEDDEDQKARLEREWNELELRISFHCFTNMQ